MSNIFKKIVESLCACNPQCDVVGESFTYHADHTLVAPCKSCLKPVTITRNGISFEIEKCGNCGEEH